MSAHHRAVEAPATRRAKPASTPRQDVMVHCGASSWHCGDSFTAVAVSRGIEARAQQRR